MALVVLFFTTVLCDRCHTLRAKRETDVTFCENGLAYGGLYCILKKTFRLEARRFFVKKIILVTVLVVCMIISAVAVSACNDGGSNPQTPASYTVTAQSGEGYTVSVPATAKAGDMVSVEVSVSSDDVRIVAVKANGTDCEVGADGKYSFTMPAENVTVTVQTEKLTQVDSDGVFAMESNAMTTVAMGGMYPYNFFDEHVWKLRVELTKRIYMTLLGKDSYVRSSDDSVIPENAITFETITDSENQSTEIIAVDVCIDTDLISAGTTWLEIFIKNGNNSSYKGTLMQKITVVEYGAIEIEKAKKTVVVDVSDFASEGDVYNMRFSDNDYIDGGDSAEFVDCTAIVTDGKLVFEFDYALMHKYNIGLNKGNSYDNKNLLGIMQSVSGGVNDVYDGYSVYGLMFWTADSIELEAYIKP